MKKKIVLTEKQVKEYVKGGWSKCPFCKSSDIEGQSVDMTGNFVYQEVSCKKCKREWMDTYELTDMTPRE